MAVTAPDADPFLRARRLSVRYGGLVALDEVDLDVHRGEVVALAGENGAGKSTLVRCIAGDLAPDSGVITVRDHVLAPDPRAAARLGIAVVWQDLALCDNLDVASNLLLGREPRRILFSETRFHERATDLLGRLHIDLPPTTTTVASLSGGQRQLVAVARAMRDRPDLLVLDEPTAALGVSESARVEELASSLPAQGTTVLIVTHDVEQMFRLADRIVILRRGRVVGEVDPEQSHPDEVSALLSGQGGDVSARRQLTRLHSLADQLASAEPSSSLTLILSALGAALGTEQLCVHVSDGASLRMAGAMGLPPRLAAALARVPVGVGGGQIGRAASGVGPVVTRDVRTDPTWGRLRVDARLAGVAGSWSVPFTGASGDSGVVTVMSPVAGEPSRDDLELVSLYAGYASSALERDRLLGEVTSRNRVLETIRDVLQALAGPDPFEVGLRAALLALQAGLRASGVALVTSSDADGVVPATTPSGAGAGPEVRAWAGADAETGPAPPVLFEAASRALGGALAGETGPGEAGRPGDQPATLTSVFPAPGGRAALVAVWSADGDGPGEGKALLDDAANSLRLALERDASERAQREAMALRSSQELQRQFLSWLSHELRTPLTAIRGYASSLMQPDVNWDGDDQRRFLERISDESARLGRLVDDLLDFSAIDSGILRLHRDWCDLSLVLEAAVACLPATYRPSVSLTCDADLPVIWADHDRLEQIFVNLLDNAGRHNPPGTSITVVAGAGPDGHVTVTVIDDGVGMPLDVGGGRPGSRPDRRRTGGAGLGLSIARGIVAAHGGTLDIDRTGTGTRCRVRLPVALDAPADTGGDTERLAAH